MLHQPLTREVLERLYVKECKSVREIAKLFNVSSTTVRRWLKRYQIPVRSRWNHVPKILEGYQPSKLTKGELSDFEIGYICGLIDGEGSIGILYFMRGAKRGAGKKYLKLQPYIEIVNTDANLINWLREHIGGVIEVSKHGKANWKPRYALYIYNTKLVAETLEKIADKLMVKQKQSKLVLEFCKSRLQGTYDKPGYTQREIEIAEEVRRLNGNRKIYKRKMRLT
jgi:hypothetical protein